MVWTNPTPVDLPPVNERISRRARQVRIEVHPDGEIRLIIPHRMARREAYAFLRSRANWVREKLLQAEQRRAANPVPRPLRWDGRDRLPLQGRRLTVQLIPTDTPRVHVRFTEDAITLFAPASIDQARRIDALTQALRARARQVASHCLAVEAERLGVDYGGPRIGNQKTLWGSCSAKGRISLNWRLILAPPEVLRYVVIHELCHRRHHNHSARFWQLVARQMSDFKVHRAWLHEHGQGLHSLLSL